MLVYTTNKSQFLKHTENNEIDEQILASMEEKGLGRVSASEIASWRYSMQYMKNVLAGNDIPDDAGVAIEYAIPQTAKRIDFILTGRDSDDNDTAVVIELKQWEKVYETDKYGVVETFVGGANREMPHPSY